MCLQEIEKYVENLKRCNMSQSTIINYSKDLHEFQDFLTANHILLSDVQSSHLNNFMDSLKNKISTKTHKPLSIASVNRKMMAVKSFLNYCMENGHIQHNNYAVKAIKQKEKIPVFMTKEQAIRFIDNISDVKHRLLITVLLNTGVRISELLRIKWEDVQDDGKIIIDSKGNRERVVFLNQSCLSCLKQFESIYGKVCDYIFFGENGNHITPKTAWEIVTKYSEAMFGHKKITPHKLRHTFCSIMAEAGVSDLSLQKMMGHKNINTTSLYTHLTDNGVKDIYNKNILG